MDRGGWAWLCDLAIATGRSRKSCTNTEACTASETNDTCLRAERRGDLRDVFPSAAERTSPRPQCGSSPFRAGDGYMFRIGLALALAVLSSAACGTERGLASYYR